MVVAWRRSHLKLPENQPTTAFPEQTVTPAPSATTTETETPVALPTAYQITNVGFVPQAPHKIWDSVHQETCEEAAVLTLHYYLAGITNPSLDRIEADLQAIIAWEKTALNNWEDTTAKETARILAEYYGYGDRVRVIENATLEDLRREIATGRPVLVPAAGRLLGNPRFTPPGPIYHMIVATGYTEDTVITHDPGTQFGANYRYPLESFWNAVHDFVDRTDEGMARGAKTLLVID